MEQVVDFFSRLLDPTDWPPRWICGHWTEFHGWLYIWSDVTIWLAYFIIPVIIFWFIQKSRRLEFLPIYWLFGAFILFCGATHAIDALIFYWPVYRLSAFVRFLTAIVSLATAFALIRELPKILIGYYADQRDTEGLKQKLAEQYRKIEMLQTELAGLKAEKE